MEPTAEVPRKPARPRKTKQSRKRPRAARMGAQLRQHTQAALELVADLIGSWLTRGQIIAAYAAEVDRREQARKATPEQLAAMGPKEQAAARRNAAAFPLQHRKESQLDEYIRGAKDRLAAESSPGLKAEVRAKVTRTYAITTQRLLAAGEHEAAARVVEKQAKLFGLIIDRQKLEVGKGAPDDTRDLSDEQLRAILGGD